MSESVNPFDSQASKNKASRQTRSAKTSLSHRLMRVRRVVSPRNQVSPIRS